MDIKTTSDDSRVDAGSKNVHWQDGEPNNYGEGEDCAVIVVGEEGLWNDDRCEKQAQAVCEKRGYNYKPPPTPPPPVSKCQDGWTEFSGRCYYFSADSKANTWMSAQTTCKNLNPISTLTSVSSQEEENFILRAQGFTDTAFIGGSDSGSEGNWTWLDGNLKLFFIHTMYFQEKEKKICI